MTRSKTRQKGSSTRGEPTFKGAPADDRATQYARDVVDGKIVSGPHVRNACRRHLDDLERGHDRGLVWDLYAAKHVWGFFEEVLRLSEGDFEGNPFELHPSQAFILGSIFGWKREDGNRRFRRAYIEQGKGNGKSPLAGGIALYGMTADGEAGAEVYSLGAHREQANILFRDAVKMVRQSPLLNKKIEPSGGFDKEYNLAHHAAASFFRPMSREAGRTGSGLRPHFALCDEIHEYPSRSAIEMLERGFKFRRQPLLFMITNSGTDRQSICYEEHQYAIRVAAGTRDVIDDDATYVGETWPGSDETFAFVCSLDKDDDPLEDPSCWPKANPLLDTILTQEYLAGVVAQARDIPGKRNSILRLHFCVWTDSDTAWLPRPVVEAVMEEFNPEDLQEKPVYLGLDLSRRKDLTSLAAVVPAGFREIERADGETTEAPVFDAWIESWTPRDTMDERGKVDAVPYRQWWEGGYVHAPEGSNIRYDHVAARVAQIDADYDVKCLAYDNHNYSAFAESLEEYGVNIKQVPHPQGGKRRAKPTEEQVAEAKREGKQALGLWMPGSVQELEALLLEQRIRILYNPSVIAALMGAAMEVDPLMGNYWLNKAKATVRIDPAVALAMAVGAACANVLPAQNSVYQDRGILMI